MTAETTDDGGERIVPCTVDIAHTAEFIHAYVELEGIDVGPGDEVLVLGAPADVPFGLEGVFRCRAAVRRAGPVERAMAHVRGYLELTELYEVGFSPGRS